jgi:hypothetical protein
MIARSANRPRSDIQLGYQPHACEGVSMKRNRSPWATYYRHSVAERLGGEFHEPGKRLIHVKNQKNGTGDRKGTHAQCRGREEVAGRKKPEAGE